MTEWPTAKSSKRTASVGTSPGTAPPARFPLGPFVPHGGNPILRTRGESWESSNLYNPAAIVVDDEVVLLYRAHADDIVSHIGIATSADGFTFRREETPVLSPEHDWEARGCEDPRVTRIGDTFHLTYTGWDGVAARLCPATSTDLRAWTKHGPILPDGFDTFATTNPRPGGTWHKAGVIVPQRIGGRWHLYFGEGAIFHATSDDLLHWTPCPNDQPLYGPTPGAWDELLVEIGPPPVLTEDGLMVFLTNGARRGETTDVDYRCGQIAIPLAEPTEVVAAGTGAEPSGAVSGGPARRRSRGGASPLSARSRRHLPPVSAGVPTSGRRCHAADTGLSIVRQPNSRASSSDSGGDPLTPPRRRTVAGLAAVASATVLGTLAAASVTSAAPPAEPNAQAGTCATSVVNVTPDAETQSAWADFGNGSQLGQWAAADGTYSAALPDGRTAWLFNDTFLGPVEPDGSIPPQGLLHNTIVTSGTDSPLPAETIIGGTPEDPAPVVGYEGNDQPWYWNTDGIAHGDELFVFEAQQQLAGDGHFGFEWIGTDIAVFSLPDLTLDRIVPTYDGAGITWGVELLPAGDHTYIYGVRGDENPPHAKSAFVARAAGGQLEGDGWEFWGGSGWVADENAAAPIADGVGSSFGVAEVQGQFVMVTTDSHLNPGIDTLIAPSPWEFADAPRERIYEAPEGQPEFDEGAAGDIYAYNVAVHPVLSEDDTLAVSYNVNSSSLDDVFADVSLYRARFLELAFAATEPAC
ncbi:MULTISPECIES: glycoside hydrolase family 130 protein [Streptomyces]|uniref:glycoside hydrolase family 130 protein n=1 Tax=Streptomyces TaxID=1883 RepID=UPI001D043300|nr:MULTISPECIES: hypothetical protein [Streptomyces]